MVEAKRKSVYIRIDEKTRQKYKSALVNADLTMQAHLENCIIHFITNTQKGKNK